MTRCGRATPLLLLASMMLALVSLARAAAARVVLLAPARDHPIAARMRDELQLLGLEVEVEVVSAAAPRRLDAVVREHQAAAVARIEDGPAAVVVWVDPARSATRAGDIGEIRISGSKGEVVEAGLLALRAVELLRGALLPVPRADAAPAAPSPAPTGAAGAPRDPAPSAAMTARPRAADAERGPAPQRDGRAAALLAPALGWSPGGLPAVPLVRVGAHYRALRRLGVEAVALVPTSAATVSAAEGAMDVRYLDLGVALRGSLTDADAEVSLDAGIGMGAMLFFFEGEARAPWVAGGGSRWAAAPRASVGLAWRLTPVLDLRADVLAALVRPEPVLRIAGREVASFGQPALFFAAGIEVWP